MKRLPLALSVCLFFLAAWAIVGAGAARPGPCCDPCKCADCRCPDCNGRHCPPPQAAEWYPGKLLLRPWRHPDTWAAAGAPAPPAVLRGAVMPDVPLLEPLGAALVIAGALFCWPLAAVGAAMLIAAEAMKRR
jgi:hypothetical protein